MELDQVVPPLGKTWLGGRQFWLQRHSVHAWTVRHLAAEWLG